MALSEATLSAITARVRDRMIGTVLGREASSAGTTETEIAGAAVLFCNRVAPDAPEAILREASIRLAGWLYGNRPHVSEHEHTDPPGTTIKLRFNNSAATANGFRASGASSMLARHIKRRGGLIDATSERVTGTVAAPAPDIGTTVMRCGFATTLPFTDNIFRWIGTANGVELDSSWNQPAAFGFWLPNDVMSRVIAVVLLRSIPAGSPGVDVNLAAFGPAGTLPIRRYRRDASPYTPVTFDGQLFRAERLSRGPGRATLMRWWWQTHTEERQAAGGYTSIISALIGAHRPPGRNKHRRRRRPRPSRAHSHELSPTRALMVRPTSRRRCPPERWRR